MATLIGKMMVKHQIWSTIWTNPKDAGSLKIWVGWCYRTCVIFQPFFDSPNWLIILGRGWNHQPVSDVSRRWAKMLGDPAQRTRTSRTAAGFGRNVNQKPEAIPNFTQWLSRNGSFQNSKPYIYNLGSSIGFTKLELHHKYCTAKLLRKARRNVEAWSGYKPWSFCPLSVPERSKARGEIMGDSPCRFSESIEREKWGLPIYYCNGLSQFLK